MRISLLRAPKLQNPKPHQLHQSPSSGRRSRIGTSFGKFCRCLSSPGLILRIAFPKRAVSQHGIFSGKVGAWFDVSSAISADPTTKGKTIFFFSGRFCIARLSTIKCLVGLVTWKSSREIFWRWSLVQYSFVTFFCNIGIRTFHHKPLLPSSGWLWTIMRVQSLDLMPSISRVRLPRQKGATQSQIMIMDRRAKRIVTRRRVSKRNYIVILVVSIAIIHQY